jgi:translation initiation factor 3 subunit B
MSHHSYLSALEDYEEIKEYLELDSYENFDSTYTNSTLPPFRPDFSTAIIVENLPSVAEDKYGKLLSLIAKIYQNIAPITEADIYMPMNEETKVTGGFCFIRFPTKEVAELAIEKSQGRVLDKRHTFKVRKYTDLDRFAAVPDEYQPKKPPAFTPRPDPTSWLTDTQCRDQFVVRYSLETQIFWANHTGEEPSPVYGGEREKVGGKVWCESYVVWSPQGTYLATFHLQGIMLWGSADFKSLGKFMHPKVEELSFSPCENYLISYRYTIHPDLNAAEAIIVWDVRSNSKLKCFELKSPLDLKFQVLAQITPMTQQSGGEAKKKEKDRTIRGRIKAYREDINGGVFTIEEGNVIHEDIPFDKVTPIQEPNRLKWSPDGKYLARLGNDMITVRQLPSMAILGKKSIAANEVLDFVWSPRSNLISYWSPAVGNYPAMINIIKVPEREDICSRKLFDVTDGRMVWQNEGDYLCVHMTKMQGKKKSFVLMFFRVKDTGVPVEQLELTEPILNVSWEPSGSRIIIMHGEVRSPSIAFYSMGNKGELTHLFTKTGSQCNEVLWSPAGGVVALAYFASDSCIFDLHDVDNNIALSTRRHDRCTRLYWDPSGRFIASCTITELRNSTAKGHFEDGFNIYTFQGNLLCQVKKEKLYQFLWRPRPKDLLTPEEKKKVIKNLRNYERLFERDDRVRKQELHQELQAAKYKQAEEFIHWLNRNRAINAALKPARISLRNGYDSDDEDNYRIEVLSEETVIKSTEQIMH